MKRLMASTQQRYWKRALQCTTNTACSSKTNQSSYDANYCLKKSPECGHLFSSQTYWNSLFVVVLFLHDNNIQYHESIQKQKRNNMHVMQYLAYKYFDDLMKTNLSLWSRGLIKNDIMTIWKWKKLLKNPLKWFDKYLDELPYICFTYNTQ